MLLSHHTITKQLLFLYKVLQFNNISQEKTVFTNQSNAEAKDLTIL
jgi:hypothetical protein